MQHLEEGTIHAWIDGALSPSEARDVESHLATCEPCAQLAAEARGLVAASSRILMALDDVPGDVIPIAPPNASPAATPGVTPIESAASRRRITPFWMRTAAAVLVIAGTSAVIMTAKLNSPETRSVALMHDSVPGDLAAITADPPATAPDTFRSASPGIVASAPVAGGVTGNRSIDAGPRAKGLPAPPSSATQAIASAPPRPAAPAAATTSDSRVTESESVARQLQDRQAQQATIRDESLVQQRERSAREASAQRVGDLSGQLAVQQPMKTASPPPGTRTAPLATPQTAPARGGAASPAAAASAAVGATRDAMRGRNSAASEAKRADMRSVSGCYALSMSPWSGGTIPYGAPPARIELDTIRNTLGQLLVHPARGTAANGAPRAYWTLQADSVFVTWRDESRGVRLSLPTSGEVLRGRAETIPVGGAAQSSVVEATRISCQQ